MTANIARCFLAGDQRRNQGGFRNGHRVTCIAVQIAVVDLLDMTGAIRT